MITQINNISSRVINSTSSSKNPDSLLNYKNNNPSFDTFEHSISFKGIELPSGEYEKEDIEFAKQKLNESDNKWKTDLYKKIYSNLKENRPLRVFYTRGHDKGYSNMNDPVERIGLGIFTLGLNELSVQFENWSFRKEARDRVAKMDILRAELQNIKLKEEVAQMQKAEQFAAHKMTYLKEMNDVKELQIKPKLLDLIQREREGRPTDMPNCIMLSNKNDKINEELIKWAGENVNGKFITIQNGDDILLHLEEAEENYQETGDWNLLYVKGLDKLIDHNEVQDNIVEGMKDIMSAAAEDYHTTIIFSSTHPETLDKIALQPHRVKKISAEKIISPEESALNDAKERIKNANNVKDTPISTINDLLLIAGADKNVKLTWDYTEEQIKEIDKIISDKFGSADNSSYIGIYNKAKENLI